MGGLEPTLRETAAITASSDPARLTRPGDETSPIRPVRISPELRRAAAMRLVALTGPQRARAADRLLTNASAHGIDLDLIWATVAADRSVRQAVMLVPGAGRIAVAFQSGPGSDREAGDVATQRAERAACLEAAARELPAMAGRTPRLIQALPEQHEDWARDALDEAGWRRIGTLASLRCPLPLPEAAGLGVPPADVSLDRFRGFDHPADVADLHAALDRSYEQTLDCPGLTGLRPTPDIIESHASVGLFDPRNWWIARHRGSPEGCVLLNRLHDNRSVELVYIGLSTRLRGRALGMTLLTHAVRGLRGGPAVELHCAVDTRNTPALGIYETLGFQRIAERVAFVRTIEA